MAPSPDTSHIVGIGASAQGLVALKEFFGSFDDAPNHAFVVIQHLAPDTVSSLTKILQSSTDLPVTAAEAGMRVESGHIYVISPGDQLTIEDRVLQTTPLPDLDAERHTIDIFFDSLASDCKESAVGILLSGAGQDGTAGLRTIKEHGGLTLAQDPNEAGISTMPLSAIEAGVVDVVDSAAGLYAQMGEILEASHRFDERTDEDGKIAARTDEFPAVLSLLQDRTGNSFSNYKNPTILRRIGRRMQIHGVDSLEEYLSVLEDDGEEVEALFDELLIKVTQFFRDPEAWEILAERVIPELFESKGRDDQIRVWVPGCATGEEAYTIAILLTEYADAQADMPEIKVFATDISPDAIRIARAGTFPASIATDVPAEFLDSYFRFEANQYRVSKEVRNRVLFAPQNALSDPPFSNLDLITCRNLLIYLTQTAQERLLRLFHYALNPGGFLMLGPSETPTPAADLYEQETGGAHIYRARRGVDSSVTLAGPGFGFQTGPDAPVTPSSPNPAEMSPNLERIHREAIFDSHTFASVLVDQDQHLLHTTGDVSPYLSIPTGRATDDILKLVKPRLRSAVRTTLFEVRHLREGPVTRRVEPDAPDDEPAIRVQASLTEHEDLDEPLIAISFLQQPAQPARDDLDLSEDDVIAQYERELEQVERDLQTTVEEYEDSNQKLRASNEELMSMNEELQSTTEELETSKEELQSMNEELQTVNDELNEKIRELDSVNSDLRNLMRSTDIGTIFLDRNLAIKRFTDPVTDFFNLLPSDHGRPFRHVTHSLHADDLNEDAQRVLEDITTIEREVSTEDGRHLLVRALPYLTTDDRVDGVVLTFVDVTERQRIKDKLAESEKKFRTVFESAADPMFIYPVETGAAPVTILDANGAAVDITGESRETLRTKSIADILQQPAFSVDKHLQALKDTGHVQTETRLSLSADHRDIPVDIHSTRVTLNGRTLAVTVVRDISHQKAYEEALIESKDRAEELAELRSMFLSTLSHDVRSPLTTIITIASVLEKEATGEDSEMVERIQRAAEQLRTILDSILRMAELETNEAAASPEDFDLVRIVDEVIDLHEPIAENSDITLTYDGVERCPVHLDSRFLTQILNNLVDNALKYTDQGEIVIRVSEDGDRVHIEVEDTGRGIPAEQQERIFDWFERGSDQTAGELGSVGLGLAITNLLAEAMEGTIDVDSEPGRGSCFTVSLPKRLAQADSPDSVA